MAELPKIDKEALKRDEKRTIVALKYILQTLEDRLKSGEIKKEEYEKLREKYLDEYVYILLQSHSISKVAEMLDMDEEEIRKIVRKEELKERKQEVVETPVEEIREPMSKKNLLTIVFFSFVMIILAISDWHTPYKFVAGAYLLIIGVFLLFDVERTIKKFGTIKFYVLLAILLIIIGKVA